MNKTSLSFIHFTCHYTTESHIRETLCNHNNAIDISELFDATCSFSLTLYNTFLNNGIKYTFFYIENDVLIYENGITSGEINQSL